MSTDPRERALAAVRAASPTAVVWHFTDGGALGEETCAAIGVGPEAIFAVSSDYLEVTSLRLAAVRHVERVDGSLMLELVSGHRVSLHVPAADLEDIRSYVQAFMARPVLAARVALVDEVTINVELSWRDGFLSCSTGTSHAAGVEEPGPDAVHRVQARLEAALRGDQR